MTIPRQQVARQDSKTRQDARTRPDSTDWRTAARCGEADPEEFFPESGASAPGAVVLCAACEVRLPCLEWALTHHEAGGIWGGLSGSERSRLLADRRRRAARRWMRRGAWDAALTDAAAPEAG